MSRNTEPNRTRIGCRSECGAVDTTSWGMINPTKENTMNPRIDYTQVAARLDYTALDQKLGQLQEQDPPKKRKQIGDVLAPVEARLRDLRANGWTYEQLTKELNDFGLPVKPAALRDYLTARKAKGTGRNRQRCPVVPALRSTCPPSNPRPTHP